MQISSAALLKASGTATAPATLAERYGRVRRASMALAAPLSAEDAMLQSMPDASPAKWHLAHTSWFFEQFVLGLQPGYRPLHPHWQALFNSYYQSIGPAHARARRGLLSRPTLAQVLEYRAQVDERIGRCLRTGALDEPAQRHLLLGLQHEQQHQELLLTDIKHALWSNPLQPAYRDDLPPAASDAAGSACWLPFPERIVEIGAPPWPANAGFAYDNESPRHRVLVPAHALANRPLSNAEYRAFIDDGGYREPLLWMSDGWAQLQAGQWRHPLYWDDALEREYTLGGWRALDPDAPVCHLGWYEADACARWAGARLPTEFEWEAAAAACAPAGNFADTGLLHPAAQAGDAGRPRQLFGDVWEWTASAYGPYPGFRPLPGSAGEYNGKFMCGQQVLRGGSCATPAGHVRASYRNFFPPAARWQFSGLRLARDA
ncbi:ergothioneine biosynthesis protein EgtB [Stenotrophomonas sp. NLF4-10]|uniref:ergothioneine biosynthesis protein EgtB n=1 Tax=Stenotrophomonas sp. NLF4-10 TaxID=2918754 RepID=UPI001EFBE358|nr:ergothioneine biosynthesis protein EgtB [Stenotrophomonas sp. NLF4-10]MCG8275053.1 ergothioneine biosynthesis protein EgtB [Stenotrophomonas sp. NLF4-10]